MPLNVQQIWEQLVSKNPKLADDEATTEFKAKHLRSLLRQVWEQGEMAGKETLKTRTEMQQLFRKFGNPFK